MVAELSVVAVMAARAAELLAAVFPGAGVMGTVAVVAAATASAYSAGLLAEEVTVSAPVVVAPMEAATEVALSVGLSALVEAATVMGVLEAQADLVAGRDWVPQEEGTHNQISRPGKSRLGSSSRSSLHLAWWAGLDTTRRMVEWQQLLARRRPDGCTRLPFPKSA